MIDLYKSTRVFMLDQMKITGNELVGYMHAYGLVIKDHRLRSLRYAMHEEREIEEEAVKMAREYGVRIEEIDAHSGEVIPYKGSKT